MTTVIIQIREQKESKKAYAATTVCQQKGNNYFLSTFSFSTWVNHPPEVHSQRTFGGGGGRKRDFGTWTFGFGCFHIAPVLSRFGSALAPVNEKQHCVNNPNQFGSLIKVVAEVVEGNFWKSHYFPQNLLIFLVITEDFLTKVVDRAVIFNLKKSLQKIFEKSCWLSRYFQQQKVVEKDFLTKVVGRAVIFNIKSRW